MKKYELTDATIEYIGHTLHRIRAVRSFGDVKKGELGGFLESEINLTHEGNCWVAENARISGAAQVNQNAQVFGFAQVSGDTQIFGEARIFGFAQVSGFAQVFGKARIFDFAQVSGDTQIFGKAEVSGNAVVCGDAVVAGTNDYIVFKNWWSSGRHFTWTRSNNMWKVGCFYGKGEELIAKAYEDSEKSCREYERVVKYVESILTEEPGPIHYNRCAICHRPIPFKGKSRIELSDTRGNTERVEGLCQECYLKFYNAIKGQGRGLV
ncbi:MAG: polymer-forming cytoskeletal protein [Kiritimatiellae bacterium]|nr:polymer-forming cytoskeletal protein [Kiritimatiellia bacterium]